MTKVSNLFHPEEVAATRSKNLTVPIFFCTYYELPGYQAWETSYVKRHHERKICILRPHVYTSGHSLYDLGQETGNEVFYALTCSY